MGYFSADHVSENSTVLQISVEEFEKVCLNCRNAQLVILWLKSMNYVHVMTLHDATKVVQQDINRFKVRDDEMRMMITMMMMIIIIIIIRIRIT